jgi:hypothetical protein
MKLFFESCLVVLIFVFKPEDFSKLITKLKDEPVTNKLEYVKDFNLKPDELNRQKVRMLLKQASETDMLRSLTVIALIVPSVKHFG